MRVRLALGHVVTVWHSRARKYGNASTSGFFHDLTLRTPYIPIKVMFIRSDVEHNTGGDYGVYGP